MLNPSHFSLATNVTLNQGAFGAKRSCQYGSKRQVLITYFFCHISEDWQKISISKHTQMSLSILVKFFSNRWSVRAWVVVTCMSLPGWSCQLKELGSIGGHMCLSLFLKLRRMIVILSLFSKHCRTFVFVFVIETLLDTCVCLCIYNIAGHLCLRGPMTLQ